MITYSILLKSVLIHGEDFISALYSNNWGLECMSMAISVEVPTVYGGPILRPMLGDIPPKYGLKNGTNAPSFY